MSAEQWYQWWEKKNPNCVYNRYKAAQGCVFMLRRNWMKPVSKLVNREQTISQEDLAYRQITDNLLKIM